MPIEKLVLKPLADNPGWMPPSSITSCGGVAATCGRWIIIDDDGGTHQPRLGFRGDLENFSLVIVEELRGRVKGLTVGGSTAVRALPHGWLRAVIEAESVEVCWS
jgi:hypothetical protein